LEKIVYAVAAIKAIVYKAIEKADKEHQDPYSLTFSTIGVGRGSKVHEVQRNLCLANWASSSCPNWPQSVPLRMGGCKLLAQFEKWSFVYLDDWSRHGQKLGIRFCLFDIRLNGALPNWAKGAWPVTFLFWTA